MKVNIKVILLLFIFTTPFRAFSDDNYQETKTAISTPEDDYIALRALYLNTNGDGWNNNEGWLTAAEFMSNPTMPAGTNLGTWHGITTNPDGTVICLDMDGTPNCSLNQGFVGNNLTGTIPPELGDLSSMYYLSLYNNNLTGSIPPELGNLTNLTRLWLHDNNLSGNIPPTLGNLTNVLSLGLNINQLTGSIPVELANMSNLRGLNLSDNNLTGNIPPELGNLIKLTRLDLRQCQLNGTIPVELGNLTALTYLNLSSNYDIAGTIPTELGNLSYLEELRLNNNDLTGTIPVELGNIPQLSRIFLYRNELQGDIPAVLGNLNNLEYMYIHENELGTCYAPELMPLCDRLVPLANRNEYISDGNNFDATWEDFCATEAGTCTVNIDNTYQSTFTVYPVPAKDFVVFDVPNIAAADEIILYDITGKQISRQAFPQDKRLAISHLNDGVYIYRIFYEYDMYSGKIVVE